jgi:hypothetical protein
MLEHFKLSHNAPVLQHDGGYTTETPPHLNRWTPETNPRSVIIFLSTEGISGFEPQLEDHLPCSFRGFSQFI